MEENVKSVTVRSAGIRYGLILALIGILMFVVYSILGVDFTGWARWLGYPIYIVIIILGHQYFKSNGDGFMSYGQGVGIAFWISLISSSISSVFTYLYIKLFDSSMLDMIKQKQIESMEGRGMSDEQIDQAMRFASMFTSAEAILIFGIIGGIITMVILGLIISIFTQKSNPKPTF